MSVHKKCMPKVMKNCRGTPMSNSSQGNLKNQLKQVNIIFMQIA